MDYELSRIDYAICGITYPDTLKLIPGQSAKSQQKFIVGDKNGVLQCLSIKDEEPVVHFKTLPGKPITSVQVAFSADSQTEKIYAASGNEVKGYNRKGKVFLTIETLLSETITSMLAPMPKCVVGHDLILGCSNILTHYRDLKEISTYTCEDRILDLAVFNTPNSARHRVMILVANKGVILLDGTTVLCKADIANGPTRILVPASVQSSEINHVIYGAVDGSIGVISFPHIGSRLQTKCLVEGKSLGPVMCLGLFENHRGSHIAVGRHDGSVQLYHFDKDNITATPRLKYSYFCGEPVTSIAGGIIGLEEEELLVATFSGRIFGLRSSTNSSRALASNITQEALTARRIKLENEISRLEKQAGTEREKYQSITRNPNSNISVPPLLEVQSEISDISHNGWQEITISSAIPLDLLFIYCKNNLNIETDSAAVLSICPPQVPNLGTDLLATIRCQAGTKRLWMRVKIPKTSLDKETSSHEKLQVYALPAGAPRVARVMEIKIPILAFYSKHEYPEELEKDKRCWCGLEVTGNFSVAEINTWLSDCLPGTLPKPGSSVIFARSHSLIRTALICRYQKGKTEFKCENISTISLLRDLLTHHLMESGIRFEVHLDIPEECCIQNFKKIENLFQEQYVNYTESKLKNALRSLDLETENHEENNICKSYFKAFTSTIDIKNSFIDMVEIIKQWYSDWHKLQLRKNKTLSQDLKELEKKLHNCEISDIEKILSPL